MKRKKKFSGISSSSTEDNDRKRRAQAAAHRKAKVLAQMNQMQKKFAKTYEKDLASMEVTESEVNKTAAETLENNESKKSQINSNSIAIGPNRSVPQNNSKMYTCILCQEDDTVDRNTLVNYYNQFNFLFSTQFYLIYSIFFLGLCNFYCEFVRDESSPSN